MPSFTPGVATSLTIPVTLTTASLSGNTSRINVFADWNGDGDGADAGETPDRADREYFRHQNIQPYPAAINHRRHEVLRIRITEGTTAPSFAGSSSLKGEVEDYAITVLPAKVAIGSTVWLDTGPNRSANGMFDTGEGLTE